MNSKKNRADIILNMVQQLVTLTIPLITMPYLARILGATGIGVHSYTDSIVQYFVLFGVLGLTVYGTRQIAYVRDSKQELSETFWEIFALRVVSTSIALLAYLAFVFCFTTQYRLAFIIQALVILTNTVDISWLYIGIGDFRKTVLRSILIKLIGLAGIFIFIKKPTDYYLYILLLVVINLLGNLSLWTFLPKTVMWIKPSKEKVLIHLKPTLMLFLPEVAIQMYAYFDKTMIGLLMHSVDNVAFYSKAQEIAKIPLSLIGAVSTVMLPYMSNLHSNKQEDEFKRLLNQNLRLILFVSLGASFGMAGIAGNLIPWLLGADFAPSIVLLRNLSVLTVIISVSNLIGKQYLLPVNKLKAYTLSVIFGATLNFILNLILITNLGVLGACISTIAAEIFVSSIQLIFARKMIAWRDLLSYATKYIIAAVIMLIVVIVLGRIMQANLIGTFIQIFVGASIYVLCLLVLREALVMSVINGIKGKLYKIKK